MIRYIILLFVCCFCSGIYSYAQPGASDVEIQKPKEFEDNTLPAEKTGQKKFGITKRFLNNTMTHFNYYFNANNKLKDVITAAKTSFRDDYDSILPFYNFTLDATKQSKGELDSVIYKCTAGIYLHNLRNDWIDDLWMLVGQSYYYQKMFDSAAYVFQYVNYAWADKEEGGYDIPIASNYNGATEFTVATKEKKNPLKHRPSRNDALLWLCRNYITIDKYPQAGTLLEIFQSDPNFPKRYDDDIKELKAFLYYKQKNYDSAAVYLEQSLPNAHNGNEKARWQYLIAQMYQARNKVALAGEFYTKAANTTNDPILELNASLNAIKVRKGDKDFVQDKLEDLLKMAKRDKYIDYRDVIYYTAAQIEVERKNYTAAEVLLLKSVKYSTANLQQKSMSYELLGNITYNNFVYVPSHNYYDSVIIGDLHDKYKGKIIENIKSPLTTVFKNLTTIHNEDSLQYLSKMPAKERDDIIKATVKRLRKAKGLKDDGAFVNPAVAANASIAAAPELFPATTTSGSGSEWYFNNQQLKAQGIAEFKKRFGNRPNVDNWRRANAIFAIGNNSNNLSAETTDTTQAKGDDEITFESLYNKIPFSEEKTKRSNALIEKALFSNGITEETIMEHYQSAIASYEELLRRFPNTTFREEALFHLAFCYKKTGEVAKADSLYNILDKDFSDGELNKKRKGGGKNNVKKAPDAATLKYSGIYDLFLEGKFEEAKKEKLVADSIYGTSGWTPQLVFIEAVYYMKEKQDSIALAKLNFIVRSFNGTPLAVKSAKLIEILGRRKEIESYLTNLNVTRNEDDVKMGFIKDTLKVVAATKPITAPVVVAAPTMAPPKDTIKTVQPAQVKNFVFNAKDPQYVIVFLSKVAGVFTREAANSYNMFNRSNFYGKKIDVTNFGLNENYSVVLIGPFNDVAGALGYVDKAKPQTPNNILSFITADKYKYSIISQSNLDLLKENKDVNAYHALIEKALPGRL